MQNQTWIGIESAPKDGTDILFCDDYRNVSICWWGTKSGCEGWISDSCIDFGGFEEPTYWMPLPEART